MALSPVYSPEEMRRVGGGRGEARDDFAGLGGSFAGPGAEFVAGYLQNRISGMNRATVSPRVNQMRVMASPEFALAKTLGISTPYNSGGSQVDVQRARQRMNSPSSMERDAAQAQMAKFQQRAAAAPRNPVMSAAGLASAGDAIGSDDSYSGPVPSQSGFDEIQKRFGRPQEKIAPVSTTPTAPSAPTPTIPSTGDQAATPISPQEARDATKAPIGAELPATSGEAAPTRPAMSSAPTTPSKDTTKGPRLDTERISNANDARDAMTRRKDFAPDADERMGLSAMTNQMQGAREAAKKSYDTQVQQQANVEARNQKFFGNPAGPDGGKSFASQGQVPPLQPLGAETRGGTITGAAPYKPGGSRAEGIMTNRPAQSQAELEERAAKYAADGERNRTAKEEGKMQAFREKRDTERFPVKDKGKPTQRGYAGPTGRRVA